MRKLVATVTAQLNADPKRKKVIPTTAVDALVHRLYLDNVRNIRVVQERKSKGDLVSCFGTVVLVSADHYSTMRRKIEIQRTRRMITRPVMGTLRLRRLSRRMPSNKLSKLTWITKMRIRNCSISVEANGQ
jgi:hypothetical protein